MEKVKTMEEILLRLKEYNNDINYQLIQVSTKYPDLPEEVKGFINLCAIDRETTTAVIKELGRGILERDKHIAIVLKEIDDIKRRY